MSRPALQPLAVRALRGAEYHGYVRDEVIPRVRQRLWAALFIADVTAIEDANLVVRRLCAAVANLARQKRDVRILVGNSTVRSIWLATRASCLYLASTGIAVRQMRLDGGPSLHSKFVLADKDLSVVGSQNWSPGGLERHYEDALAVRSPSVSRALSRRFQALWRVAVPIDARVLALPTVGGR